MRKNFWEVARQVLVDEKKRPLRHVALALGMEYGTLYSRVTGRAPFRPEEITALLIEVPDTRLVDALLEETNFIAVERPNMVGWGNGAEALTAALRSAQELLEVIVDINSASGTRLSSAGRNHIESHINEAERSLARLRLALPHLPATSEFHAA